MNLERLEKGQNLLWYQEHAWWLKLWKSSEEYGFLKECPSQVLQQKLMDLQRAFKDCFDRNQPMKRLPVFKKRGRGDGIRFPQGFRIENRRLFLPKIGWVGFFHSRSIVGKIKNITITQKAGRWYASIQVEQEIDIGRHPSQSSIGIDAGIKCFAAFSDGTLVGGSEEVPGRNVRAKSGLNKSILDQGWYEFQRQLGYKLEWMGGSLTEVDARHTSQRCLKCGHTEKGNRKSQAEFVCLYCGKKQHADINAAKNILTVGLTGMACGSNRKGGRKQEPAGNSDGVLPLAS